MTGASSRPKSTYSIETKDVKRHVQYVQSGGELCEVVNDTYSRNYTWTVEVYCNAEGHHDEQLNSSAITINETDKCNPIMTFSHKTGCPIFSATSWVRFLVRNPWIMGTVAIVMGFIMAYWGRELFPWVIAVVGGGITFLCLMLICSVLGMLTRIEGNEKGSPFLVVLSFLISIAGAVGAGFLFHKLLIVGAMALGGFAGFFLGATIYNLAFYWAHSIYALCFLSFGVAILLAAAAYKFHDHIVLYGTALLGSYCFIRGWAVFFGHYPNEVMLYGKLAAGDKPPLDWEFYVYMAAFVIMFITGAIVQEKRKHKGEDHFKKAK